MQTVTEQQDSMLASVAHNVPAEKTKNTKIKVQSRFGEIEVDLATTIVFKHGLLGIPEAVNFVLTALPNVGTDQFKLLQSLDDMSLSFIVVPADYENQIIETKDLKDACEILSINTDNLLVLFVVTVIETGKERRVSVNAKAPVLVDAVNRKAAQYVLQSDKYEIQHMIS